MRTLLKAAAYLSLLSPSLLSGQAPDVSQGPLSFTGTGAGPAVFVGAGGPGGIIAWRLTYFVDGASITAAQVAIQGADAPNSAGCASASFASITTTAANLVESSNPSASAAQGNVAVKSFFPCVRVNVTAITGSGGRVTTILNGYKGTFVFPSTVTTIPSGTQDVNLVSPLGQKSMPASVPVVVASDQTNLPVSLADTSQRDAFNRLRSSSPVTVFDSQFQYNLQPLIWESVLTAGGTAANIANASSVLMTVSTNGDQVVRQSHRYLRYQPGKSQLIAMTGVMGAIKANTRQRIGYFDAQNGLFFEQNGANLRVVQRSFISGSAVDTAVNQASWNLDPLNGTGPSGITLNMADAQIFIIDLQWLGAGRVRFGFDLGGQIIYCHQFLNANALTGVYMTTANLPARYELTMTGATTATTMTQICQSIISEGGFEDERGFLFTANNGITPISVSTRRPVLSIRPKTTFNSISNRGFIEPQGVEAEVGSGTALIEIVYNGTLTGAAFTSVDANSLTERDVSSSAISGGTVVLSFYVSGAGATARNAIITPLGSLVGRLIALTLDAAGTTPDVLTVVATSFTGSVDVTGVFQWKEIY